jgi:hypothetical protein
MKRAAMKRILIVPVLIGSFCGHLQANTPAPEVRGFARLKSLVGNWEGKGANGAVVRATFKLVASDSALLETDTYFDGSTELTVYSMDIDHVCLTRYSKANNQPRLEADPNSGDARELDFSFVGATNLHHMEIGHVQRLRLRFLDEDHFTATWTWHHNGAEQDMVFQFQRTPQ